MEPLPERRARTVPSDSTACFSPSRLRCTGRTTSSKQFRIAAAIVRASPADSTDARTVAPSLPGVNRFLTFPYAQLVETAKGGLASTTQSGRMGQSCLTCSPRPVARAVPPRKKKGTSDPKALPSASSSPSSRSRPRRRDAPARSPAASLLPPPSPAPTGIRLRSRTRIPESFFAFVRPRIDSQARSIKFGPGPGIEIPRASNEKPESARSIETSSSSATAWRIVSIS